MTRLVALQQMRRTRRQDEYRLQCSICQLLRMAGVKDLIFYHPANGLVSNPVSVSRMKGAGLRPGVADLSIILPGGQAVQVEVKAPGGVLSVEQLEFAEACKANGTRYFVVASLDEAIEVFTAIGALRIDRVRGLKREPLREAAE